MAGVRVLRDMDRSVRTAVKQWLKLDPSTANGLIYLGAWALSSWRRRFQYSSFGDCSVFSEATTLGLAPLWSCPLSWEAVEVVFGAKGGPPQALLQIFMSISRGRLTAKYWRESERRHWAQLQTQGLGVGVFKDDKLSNGWLCVRPPGMSESDFILALKVRLNTVPTLAMHMRGWGSGSAALCRVCGCDRETVRHIVSHCKTLQQHSTTTTGWCGSWHFPLGVVVGMYCRSSGLGMTWASLVFRTWLPLRVIEA